MTRLGSFDLGVVSRQVRYGVAAVEQVQFGSATLTLDPGMLVAAGGDESASESVVRVVVDKALDGNGRDFRLELCEAIAEVIRRQGLPNGRS